MRPECIQRVETFRKSNGLGAKFDSAAMEQRVRNKLKELYDLDRQGSGFRTLPMTERMKVAADAIAKDVKSELIAAQVQRIESIKKKSDYDVTAAASGLTPMAHAHHAVVFSTDQKGNVRSMETERRALKKILYGELDKYMEATGGYNAIHLSVDPEMQAKIYSELGGQKTGDAKAKEAAEAIKKLTDKIWELKRDAGWQGGYRKDFGLPRHYDGEKVRKVSQEEFSKDFLEAIETNHYVALDGSLRTPESMSEFANSVKESIGFNGLMKRDSTVRGTRSHAKRNTNPRELVFKNFEAEKKFMEKYGDGDLHNQLLQYVDSASREIVAMKRFTPDYDGYLDQIILEARQKEAKLGIDQNKTQAAESKVRREFDHFLNRHLMTGDRSLHRKASVARTWTGPLTKLGSLLFSQFGDAAQATVFAMAIGADPVRLWTQAFKNITNKEARTRSIQLTNAGIEEFATTTISLAEEGLMGLTGKAANFMFETQGASHWTRSWVAASEAIASEHLTGIVNKYSKLGELDQWDQQFLRSKGITDDDFSIWKAAEKVGDDSGKHLTTQSIMSVSDDVVRNTPKVFAEIVAIQNALGKKPSKEKLAAAAIKEQKVIQDAKWNAALSAKAYMDEVGQMMVLRPGIQEQAGWLDYQRGTMGGEIFAATMQFKTFPWMYFQRNLDMARSKGLAGGSAYALGLLGMGTVMGGIGVLLGDIVTGKDTSKILYEYDPKAWWRFVSRAAVKGGGLGLPMDFFTASGNLNDGAEKMLGPTVDTTWQAAKILASSARWGLGAASGEESKENIARATHQLLKSNTPFQNYIFTRLATDRLLFDQWRELASPGSMERVKRTHEKMTGSQYWWEPGETTPSRAPQIELTR